MAIDIITLALAKKYTDTEIAGGGAIKGKNCVISDISAITGGNRVTFQWTLDNGTVQTGTMDVMDGEDGEQGETGLGVKSVTVNNSNHLIVTYDDDTTEDAGEIKDVSTSFDKITDVDLSNLQDGQILKYNATTRKWENASAGTVDTDLVDLNDVDVENLSDGQIIVWDAASSRWVNADNAPSITIDPAPTSESENAVSSGGVYTALSGKVDAVSGKVLSDNNYSDADAAAVAALGTAASLDVAASGDASTTEVVKGDDTRLTDSRSASDVYEWAKASTKPSYTASEVGAVATTSVGVANGVAELDSTGKVPSAQLPSYVDAVVEGYLYNGAFYEDAQHTIAITPSTGVIYVDLVSNNTYRWGGSAYAEISESLALGETSTTAYRGDHGKANADAITAIKDGTTIDSFGDVETALADKISKSQTAGLVKNDGTIDTTTYVSDISGKADKVTSATNGNFAGLDNNGNITDSGSKASDFLTSHQDISGKADKVTSATSGDFAGLDANGNLTDSGKKASDFATPSDVQNVYETMGANGAKNLLRVLPVVATKEQNGITFTVYRNADGQLTKIDVDGTASALAYLPLYATNGTYYDAEFIGKRVILTGCPAGGSTDTYFIDAYRAGTKDGASGTYDDTGSGVEFNWLNDGSGTAANLTINIKQGTHLDHAEFYPMVRLATDPDSTFVPYAMTNKQLTSSVQSLTSSVQDLTFYLEQTVTLSTSATVAATFSNAKITANSLIDVAVSEWGTVPDDVTVSAGSCVVTMPIAETAHSVTVRIYVR